MRAYSLKRQVIQHGEKEAAATATPSLIEPANAGDIEKGPKGEDTSETKKAEVTE